MKNIDDKLTEKRVTITQATIDGYADLSGDYNPIHVDEQFAAKTQFGGRIAHGMLGVALINSALAHDLGADWNKNAEAKFKFKKPIKAGETVKITGIIRTKNADKMVIDVDCYKADDEVAISATIAIPNLK